MVGPSITSHGPEEQSRQYHREVPWCLSVLEDLGGRKTRSAHLPSTTLVLYTQHLSEFTESKAAVEEAVHALSWLHGVAGLQPLGGLPLVKATLEGLRRILAKPKVRNEPVTADMLKAMVEAAGPTPP